MKYYEWLKITHTEIKKRLPYMTIIHKPFLVDLHFLYLAWLYFAMTPEEAAIELFEKHRRRENEYEEMNYESKVE